MTRQPKIESAYTFLLLLIQSFIALKSFAYVWPPPPPSLENNELMVTAFTENAAPIQTQCAAIKGALNAAHTI